MRDTQYALRNTNYPSPSHVATSPAAPAMMSRTAIISACVGVSPEPPSQVPTRMATAAITPNE